MTAQEIAVDLKLFMDRFVAQHNWYIQLIVRSKLLEQLGYEPADEEMATHVRWLQAPMDEEFLRRESVLTVTGVELVAWRGPRYNVEQQTFVMDYWR